MKYRPSAVQIWFLDENLMTSAKWLTDAALDKTIDGCFAAMSCALLHFAGIRKKKIHDILFGRERKHETMDRFFSGWPFRTCPQLRYYSSRASKWTRMCLEHFEYILSYFDVLLLEYETRHGRNHKLFAFSDWVKSQTAIRIPAGNVKSITLPWKSIAKRFRKSDILEGYRLQYMDVFCWEDPIGAYKNSPHDIPEFVIRHYGLDTADFRH